MLAGARRMCRSGHIRLHMTRLFCLLWCGTLAQRNWSGETAMAHIAGGCLCGKVRYSADADPIFTGVCHCRNCQKESGSAFAIVVAVPQPTLNIRGELKTYEDKGDSGKPMYRRFCPECGSTVMDEASAMPDVLMIQAGTLDDSSWLKPAMQIYCDSAQSWLSLSGEWQRFPKMPS
jgi:hypothetical protein